MQHSESPTSSVAPQSSRADVVLTDLGPRSPNTLNLLLGGLALVTLVGQAYFAALPSLVVSGAALLAADLLLAVRVDQQRTLRLSSPFAFIVFLLHGAVAAAVLYAAGWALVQVVDHAHPKHLRAQISTIASRAAQQLVCGLTAGLAVWLTLGTAPLDAPQNPAAALAIYVLVYLACYLIIGLVTTVARPARAEAPLTTPDTDLWVLLAFVLGAPAALLVLSLQTQLGFAIDLLLAFTLLAALSYSIQLRLRLDATALEYSVLNDISRSLSGSVELNKLYPAIYSRVRQVMPAEVFLIGLLNEEQTAIDVSFLVEHDELLAPRTLALTDTVVETVVRSGKPLYLPDGAGQLPHLHFGQASRETIALVFVPLCLGEVVIGVLSAQSYARDAYSSEQIALLDAIGRISAVAINNARLFAREKEIVRGREEFVSLVAHELKNPLAALLGHTQILERRLLQADDKLRRPVSIIQEQGERMNRLVEDLLDLSRADTGRLVLHFQRLDLGSLICNVVEQQRILATQHQITVVKQDEVPVIQGDALRLTQVLQNLLSNAIKYSPEGGQITVRIEVWANRDARWPTRLCKTVDAVPRWAVVRLADEGIGVPADQIARIFDRFYRATNTVLLDIPGSGLGLSVCEGLVRAQGGVIWAESEWGKGSLFSFALPIPTT